MMDGIFTVCEDLQGRGGEPGLVLFAKAVWSSFFCSFLWCRKRCPEFLEISFTFCKVGRSGTGLRRLKRKTQTSYGHGTPATRIGGLAQDFQRSCPRPQLKALSTLRREFKATQWCGSFSLCVCPVLPSAHPAQLRPITEKKPPQKKLQGEMRTQRRRSLFWRGAIAKLQAHLLPTQFGLLRPRGERHRRGGGAVLGTQRQRLALQTPTSSTKTSLAIPN